jgi:acyl-coenzyme A thioesterase PaaI-like protein
VIDVGAEGGRADSVRDLADAVRDLIHRMVATEAPAEVFAGLADDLRAAAARFEPYPKQYLFHGVHEAALADVESVGDDYQGPFDLSPLLGLANPLAPPMRLAVSGDEVEGTVTFGPAYEGPPGCVHGGYIAAAFDELLGLVQIIAGNPGMTGRLTVHYRSPTPLGTELTLRGRLIRRDGKKNFCEGEIHAGDRLCAEAEGLFVVVDFAKIAALAEQANKRLG